MFRNKTKDITHKFRLLYEFEIELLLLIKNPNYIHLFFILKI